MQSAAWLDDPIYEDRYRAAIVSHQVPGLDVTARYLPATPGMDIGGDFYDLIRLSDTEVAAVIGDVQGHDMTAAALMGQVRTAIRAHATAGADPGEILAHTNLLLTEIIDTSPGLLLGIDPDTEYVTTDLNMPPGATMALYTDGLIERPGHDLGEAITDLAAHFTPTPGRPLPDLARSLIERTSHQRTDDIAVLLLRNASTSP